MTPFRVWRGSVTCVPWLLYMWVMTHLCCGDALLWCANAGVCVWCVWVCLVRVWRASFMCLYVAWLDIHVTFTNDSCYMNGLLICESWLIRAVVKQRSAMALWQVCLCLICVYMWHDLTLMSHVCHTYQRLTWHEWVKATWVNDLWVMSHSCCRHALLSYPFTDVSLLCLCICHVTPSLYACLYNHTRIPAHKHTCTNIRAYAIHTYNAHTTYAYKHTRIEQYTHACISL